MRLKALKSRPGISSFFMVSSNPTSASCSVVQRKEAASELSSEKNITQIHYYISTRANNKAAKNQRRTSSKKIKHYRWASPSMESFTGRCMKWLESGITVCGLYWARPKTLILTTHKQVRLNVLSCIWIGRDSQGRLVSM